MAAPIRTYLDFASPYSYFILGPLAKLAADHGRALELRPVLLWAVFKEQGMASPLDQPARRAYFLQDFERSADFFGVPFCVPDSLPISAHLAARLFYAWTADHPADAPRLAQEIFAAYFADGADIRDAAVLEALPCLAGTRPGSAVASMMEGRHGRDCLAAAVQEAVAAGVIGVPFTVLDGEAFFGADRLPQIAWRLRTKHRTELTT